MTRSYGITNVAPWAAAPTVGPAGDSYYNTANKVLYLSDGTVWRPDGASIPTGGTTGQHLTKHSGTDFDAQWTNPFETVITTSADLNSVIATGLYYVFGNANSPSTSLAGILVVFGYYDPNSGATGNAVSQTFTSGPAQETWYRFCGDTSISTAWSDWYPMAPATFYLGSSDIGNDFNNATDPGNYRLVAGTFTNGPSGFTQDGMLTVVAEKTNGRLVQVLYGLSDNTVYTRTYAGVVGSLAWTAWKGGVTGMDQVTADARYAQYRFPASGTNIDTMTGYGMWAWPASSTTAGTYPVAPFNPNAAFAIWVNEAPAGTHMSQVLYQVNFKWQRYWTGSAWTGWTADYPAHVQANALGGDFSTTASTGWQSVFGPFTYPSIGWVGTEYAVVKVCMILTQATAGSYDVQAVIAGTSMYHQVAGGNVTGQVINFQYVRTASGTFTVQLYVNPWGLKAVTLKIQSSIVVTYAQNF